MSYKEKPILKLYKYENNTFVLQAIIDDFMECSFERNLYQAGNFTISINYNIPNAQLFQRGLFVQFGNDPYDFGEIISISDAISSDGKGSQIRTITGYDSRYILKRRVIKNMNSNGLWVMTGKGEIVLRNLINDQCGAGESETKRQLPIINSIPAVADAIGKEYSVSEQFSNLYEVCKTIATQSEIGWRLKFDNSSLTLTLECYEGENRAQTVQFSTSFDSLANGQFTDSSDSYTNAIYVGGKGQNDDRDIYEGEDGAPEGLDRYESWDNQSNMTTEDEYEAEALAMLTQYGQTITVNGNGLAKCPYIYKEEYDVGDIITLAFSGKSAIVQILSVTEHWAFGQYSINFSFGKPQNNIQDQLQLILRKIQTASEKSESTDSVRWYTIPTDTEMPKADVTYRTIGFIGNVGNGATFKLYLDNEKTGAKTYHIYFKQLAGTGKLTLTTGKEGASNLILNAGTYVAIIYVDNLGNVTMAGATATDTIQTGNNQPATSSGVAQALDGKQDALTFDNVPTSGSSNPVKSGGVYTALNNISNFPSLTLNQSSGVTYRKVTLSSFTTGATVFIFTKSGDIYTLSRRDNNYYKLTCLQKGVAGDIVTISNIDLASNGIIYLYLTMNSWSRIRFIFVGTAFNSGTLTSETIESIPSGIPEPVIDYSIVTSDIVPSVVAGNSNAVSSAGVYNFLSKDIYTGSRTKYLKFNNIFPSGSSRGNAFLLTSRNREAYLLFLSTTDGENPHKPILLKISDLYNTQTGNTPTPSLNKLRKVSYDLNTKEIILTVGSYVSIGIRQIGGSPASLEYTEVTEAFPDSVTSSKILEVPEPTSDGVYNLQCTVSNGIPTYSWVQS